MFSGLRSTNWLDSHHIEEVSASGVLEPNFPASHSTSFSFSIKILGFIWTFAHTGLARQPSFPVKNFLGRVELPVSYDGKLVSFLLPQHLFFFLNQNSGLYLDVCPYGIGEAAELSRQKLSWKSRTPCLL